MITMIRAVARLCVAAVAVAALLPTAQSHAENVAYVSATGNDNNYISGCTAAQPCANLGYAFLVGSPLRVICLNGSGLGNSSFVFGISNLSLDVDCPQGYLASLKLPTGSVTVRIGHLSFWDSGAASSLFAFNASGGTVIFDDCVFTDAAIDALDIEPSGPLNLVIRNSRILNGGSGILLKPAAGGSINATLDHVTIADNTGGGLRIDTTNGPVTVDITDSVVSNNGGNGINAIGGAGGQNIVSIKNSVIAKNAVAGVQANGANAGVMIATTLLDQNTAGALSVVGGGSILTYGNNQVVGAQGSNFTGTAPLK